MDSRSVREAAMREEAGGFAVGAETLGQVVIRIRPPENEGARMAIFDRGVCDSVIRLLIAARNEAWPDEPAGALTVTLESIAIPARFPEPVEWYSI